MRRILIAAVLVVCFTPAVWAEPAFDAVSPWAKEEVGAALSADLVPEGLPADARKNISREKFCEIIMLYYRAITGGGSSAAGEPAFTDTNNPAVIEAYGLGIVSGTSPGFFSPFRGIRREEMAAMLVRAIHLTGGMEYDATGSYKLYADDGSISSYAKTDVYYLRRIGVMQGDTYNRFLPRNPVTVEQALALVIRAYRLFSLEGLASSAEGTVSAGKKTLALGMTLTEMLQVMGQPTRIDPSCYVFDYYIYNSDASDFWMVGIGQGKVVAIYTAAKQFSCGGYSAGKAAAGGTFTKNGVSVRLYTDSMSGGLLYAVFLRPAHIAQTEDRYTDGVLRAMELETVDIVNALRSRHGLIPLAMDAGAVTAARLHSDDMAENNYLSHTGLNGSTAFDRMKVAGINYSYAAENIAAGYKDAAEMADAWYNREGHRANLLSAATRTGVGVAANPGTSYVLFGTIALYRP